MKKFLSILIAMTLMLTSVCMPAVYADDAKIDYSSALVSITASISNRFDATPISAMADGDVTDTTIYKSVYTTEEHNAAATKSNLEIVITLNNEYEFSSIKLYERLLDVPCASSVDIYIDDTLALAGQSLSDGMDGSIVENTFDMTNAATKKGSVIKLVLNANTTLRDPAFNAESQYQLCEIEAYGTEVEQAIPTNVCLGKAVTTTGSLMSSVLPLSAITDGSYIDAAVNGIYDGCKTSSDTTGSVDFEVDLGAVYSIDSVKVIERIELAYGISTADTITVYVGNTTNAGTAWVRVGMIDTSENESVKNTALGGFAHMVVALAQPMNADKLKFEYSRDDSRSGCYTVYEIEAYGTFVEELKAPVNILPGKLIEVNQKSINAIIAEDKLIDGDTINDYRYASVENPDAKLEVTIRLDDVYEVSQIKIYERWRNENLNTPLKVTVKTYNRTSGWTTVVDNQPLNVDSADNISLATEFAVNDTLADSIRFIFDSSNCQKKQYELIELEAYGLVSDDDIDCQNISKVQFASADGNSEYILAPNQAGTYSVKVDYVGMDASTPVLVAAYNEGELIAIATGNPSEAIEITLPAKASTYKVFALNPSESVVPVLYSHLVQAYDN